VQPAAITAVISSKKGPETINDRSIYRHYGGNINGLKPFGEHPDLISGLKNLRRLQAGGISLIETNAE
jgi:hypothetical protein